MTQDTSTHNRTCKSIIESFNERVSIKEVIDPHEWLTASQFLAVLMGDEHAKLYELEQNYLRTAWVEIQTGKTNAEAEKKAKLTEEYLIYMKQKVFTKQVEEFIRIAKLQSKLAQAELYSQQL